MNVFILNTGRCGSVTFIKACKHISNFSSSHESRTTLLGSDRFNYPENHIEADNRLSWLLGRLDIRYGDNACYVHLRRDETDTAQSFMKRFSSGIIGAYRWGIVNGASEKYDHLNICLDYCDTINSNIELFLRDKKRKMTFRIENFEQDFVKFCELIDAKVNLESALAEFHFHYNSSEAIAVQHKKTNLVKTAIKKSKNNLMRLFDNHGSAS